MGKVQSGFEAGLGKWMRGVAGETGLVPRSHKVMRRDLGWAWGVGEFCLLPVLLTQAFLV